MTKLNKTAPQFVRCIKPNNDKAKEDFDALMVLRQLKYAGLFEAIRIRKSGFAYRKTMEAFSARSVCAGFWWLMMAAMTGDGWCGTPWRGWKVMSLPGHG